MWTSATLSSVSARAEPEMHGPHIVSTWDAGDVPAAGAALPTEVYYPSALASPSPVVAIIHGAGRTRENMAELAETLASRGLVAVVPSIPCGPFTGCDHDANAAQVTAIIDWAVLESQDVLSPLFGRIDGARRGMIGHSFGGLAILLAAARDPRTRSLVLLDPNDDLGGPAQAEAANVTAPSMHLVAENLGPCNSSGWRSHVYPLTASPHLRARVLGSGHCDPEEPTGGLCPTICGSGDHGTTVVFRRYAVAWTSCVLQSDSEMSDYLGGPSLDLDVHAGLIDTLDHAGLESLPCRAAQQGSDAGARRDGEGGDGGLVTDGELALDADASTESARDGAEADATRLGRTDARVPTDTLPTRESAEDGLPEQPDPSARLPSEEARSRGRCACLRARRPNVLEGAAILALAIALALSGRPRRRGLAD